MARRRSGAAERSTTKWSIPIPVVDIPETGRRVDVTADAPTRAALAGALGVLALPRLEVTAELFRIGRDGVRASGQIIATVEQSCVVTLDPMQSEVAEAFDLTFVAPADAADSGDHSPEVALDDGEEPPEPLRNGVVDLGAVAVEYLVLGVDPYPRKPGVTFDAPPADDSTSKPFAALAALKRDS
jgi:uncharacterized metal-binding protein YceD (DUF177 family)